MRPGYSIHSRRRPPQFPTSFGRSACWAASYVMEMRLMGDGFPLSGSKNGTILVDTGQATLGAHLPSNDSPRQDAARICDE